MKTIEEALYFIREEFRGELNKRNATARIIDWWWWYD